MTSNGHPEFGWGATLDSVDPRLLRALAEVKNIGDNDVSVTKKAKALRKFGRCALVDNTGFKTVWEGQEINDEPPLFGDPSLGNVIDTVVSEGGSDTQTLRVEGHTISGTDLTFVVQNVTLTGQTEKALGTPLHTVIRIVNLGSTEATGPVYFFDNTDGSGSGIPTDPSDVGGYLRGGAGGQQTQQCFTAVSSQDYMFITQLVVACNRQQPAAYDIHFDIKSTTGVWRPLYIDLDVASSGNATFALDLDPVLIVPPNHYIRAVARSSSANDGEVNASFSGHLALIT